MTYQFFDVKTDREYSYKEQGDETLEVAIHEVAKSFPFRAGYRTEWIDEDHALNSASHLHVFEVGMTAMPSLLGAFLQSLTLRRRAKNSKFSFSAASARSTGQIRALPPTKQ